MAQELTCIGRMATSIVYPFSNALEGFAHGGDEFRVNRNIEGVIAPVVGLFWGAGLGVGQAVHQFVWQGTDAKGNSTQCSNRDSVFDKDWMTAKRGKSFW